MRTLPGDRFRLRSGRDVPLTGSPETDYPGPVGGRKRQVEDERTVWSFRDHSPRSELGHYETILLYKPLLFREFLHTTSFHTWSLISDGTTSPSMKGSVIFLLILIETGMQIFYLEDII